MRVAATSAVGLGKSHVLFIQNGAECHILHMAWLCERVAYWANSVTARSSKV